MSRLVLVVLAVITAVSARPSFGIERVAINQWYLPDTSYSIKQTSSNHMVMSLENPLAAPEEVRRNFPLSMVVDDEREISIVTGKMAEDSRFPITIELKKAVQVMKQNDLVKSIDGSIGKLVGVRAHGTTDLEGNLTLVRLDGKELPENEQKIVIATLESVSQSLKSAKTEPIGVGEKSTKTVPIEVPVPGVMNIGLEMTTTYELLNLKDGLAEFATTYTFTMGTSPLSEEGMKLEASGKGTGKISYDVKKRVPLKTRDRIEMEMVLPMDAATIRVTTKTEDSAVTELR